MYLEIVTPEATVFGAEVEALKVPGVNGEFQMLNLHAPIVSLLGKGEVKINLTPGSKEATKERSGNFRKDEKSKDVLYYTIKGGVLEMKDNKAIVLAD